MVGNFYADVSRKLNNNVVLAGASKLNKFRPKLQNSTAKLLAVASGKVTYYGRPFLEEIQTCRYQGPLTLLPRKLDLHVIDVKNPHLIKFKKMRCPFSL